MPYSQKNVERKEEETRERERRNWNHLFPRPKSFGEEKRKVSLTETRLANRFTCDQEVTYLCCIRVSSITTSLLDGQDFFHSWTWFLTLLFLLFLFYSFISIHLIPL
jgi:hypothetical protein